MKTILLLLLFSGQLFLSQNLNTDIIINHSGDSLKVNIMSVDDIIIYNFPNESVSNSISKNCINKIIFSSGRIQKFDEKVIINGVKDWEKVIITTNPNDIKCLKRKGEVSSTSSNDWNFNGKVAIDKKATMKIKKEAAKLNAHVIFLEDQYKTNMTFWSGATSSKYGVAYSYE
ncbi:hypothetical protein [Chryseobacterium nepalense]|uniref:hypothetical protein n=1 Tax=Chryseobacterium nepalense TaxID=1854498 RepID=UPI002E0C3DB8|nr:hypothetical protein [Chryseobacterium nepalense]